MDKVYGALELVTAVVCHGLMVSVFRSGPGWEYSDGQGDVCPSKTVPVSVPGCDATENC